MQNELKIEPIDCNTMSEEFKSSPLLSRLYNEIVENDQGYVSQKDKIQEKYVEGIYKKMEYSNLWGNTMCLKTLEKQCATRDAIWDYGFSCEFMGFQMGFEAATKLLKETNSIITK